MSNIGLLTKLGFKRRLLNLRIGAVYIKVLGIFNGFRLELKIKLNKLKK